MFRRELTPREDWPKRVESQGLHYHTAEGVPYWNESACYDFTASEIDELEKATYELDRMCLEAVQHVIDRDRFDQFLIPPGYRSYVRQSWDRDEHTIYGRFDLAFDGQFPPKLLEYNADTPTALLEAAVIQWYWLQDVFPGGSQFNSVHERLIEAWAALGGPSETMYFASVAGCVEDYMNVNYLRDVAQQAGLPTAYLAVEDIGWDPRRRVFTDRQEQPLRRCFKLYPWEWMFREQFGPHLVETECCWLEPPWKSLLSNKAILPVLWELFPQSPYLLEARYEPLPGGSYVQKPILGREGANVQIFEHGRLFLGTEGPYDGPVVYQALWPLPRFADRHFACVGSWIVNGWACGIGLREDDQLITANTSRFVPHRIVSPDRTDIPVSKR
jgi:glutathionylspermidine synthase